jgi:hypothetical protein
MAGKNYERAIDVLFALGQKEALLRFSWRLQRIQRRDRHDSMCQTHATDTIFIAFARNVFSSDARVTHCFATMKYACKPTPVKDRGKFERRIQPVSFNPRSKTASFMYRF